MKLLLTGSAGFIGMHLSKLLLEKGHEIYGIDNLNDYYDPKLKENRNSVLLKYPNYHFTNASLEDKDKIKNIFAENKVDTIVHLAAQAGVRYSLENPHAYVNSNIVGFLNLLEGCREHKIPRIVYASSSNVYGKNKEYPFTEAQDVNKPVSLYAVTKRCSELMAYSYSELFDIQTIGLRFFSVYGPWGRPDMAMYIFTKAIFEEKPIDIYNHGKMERDFTYIDDIVQGIAACIDKKDLPKYEIFNLGNNKCEQLMDMIEIMENCIGKKASRNFLPMQLGDFQKSYANIDKAKQALNFSPKTNITEGIPKFVEWYKQYHNI